MAALFGLAGRAVARYLSRRDPRYAPLATSTAERLRATLMPCDVVLVEGNTRISTAIKYLTQSTWSHAALYLGVGPFAGKFADEPVRRDPPPPPPARRASSRAPPCHHRRRPRPARAPL